MCQMFHQSYSIILVLMIPTQKSINQHLSATPRHPIIHHQVITSMREIWSPRPPISMSSQSPATGAWAWASQGGGGGEKKIKKWLPNPTSNFFFFSPPPPLRSPGPGPSCWRLRTHWDWRSWRPDLPHRGDDLMIYWYVNNLTNCKV